jgi:hypothetical protein
MGSVAVGEINLNRRFLVMQVERRKRAGVLSRQVVSVIFYLYLKQVFRYFLLFKNSYPNGSPS